MSTPNPKFVKLFKAEVQNRAFAMFSAQLMLKRVKAPDDVLWYNAWLEWEEFQKRKYAPMAAKYGLDQEPGFGAKLESYMGLYGARFLSENAVMKYVLKETIKYVGKLEELASLAPEDEKPFFDYVVDQERVQVDALPFRIDGKSQEGANLLRAFMAQHAA
ncbi:MAG: hypothetical protein AAFQ04_13075 [Pseudomonadota bacterium]